MSKCVTATSNPKKRPRHRCGQCSWFEFDAFSRGGECNWMTVGFNHDGPPMWYTGEKVHRIHADTNAAKCAQFSKEYKDDPRGRNYA